MTNEFDSPDELFGIRNELVKIFRFKGLYVAARPLTKPDLADEDFVQWLNSVWRHDERNLKLFLRHKHEYEETKEADRIVQTRATK